MLSPSETEPSPKTSEKNKATMGSVEEDLAGDAIVPIKSLNINWRITLDYSTPDMVSKTLKNNTQYNIIVEVNITKVYSSKKY